MQTRQLQGYPHSSHKAIVRDDGSIVFDLYFFGDDDYSEYTTTIYVRGEAAFQARRDMENWAGHALTTNCELADALKHRFGGISSARTWLDDADIAYEEVFDHFATHEVSEG